MILELITAVISSALVACCAAVDVDVAPEYSREGLLLHRTARVPLLKSEEASLSKHANAKPAPRKSLAELPTVFDWSNVGGVNYLVPNVQQHLPTYCGSCYVHGSLSAVQDRIKISKRAQSPDVTLSRQALLNCIADVVGKNAGGGSDGCNGGSTEEVYEFLYRVGLPDETCNPYVAESSKKCDAEAMCSNCMAYAEPVMENFRCWPVRNYTKYRISEYGKLPRKQEAIMSEILARGPVACSLATFDDFDYNYTGGVWTKQDGTNESNHVVEVTGWGVTPEGVPFWMARNSWGSYWGENGFFKLERGRNLMLIEEDCWFMQVDWSDERKVSSGGLIGGMYGLRPKPMKAEREDIAFREDLQRQPFQHAPGPRAPPPRSHPDSIANHRLLVLGTLLISFLSGVVVCGLLVALFLFIRRRSDYRPIP